MAIKRKSASKKTTTKSRPARDSKRHAALVLSAGAPTAPLIAGALCKLYRNGYRFRTIYTSGGSALLGLMLVAPRFRIPNEDRMTKPERVKAKLEVLRKDETRGLKVRLGPLERIADTLGIDDAIYRFLPVGYKAFHKASPFVRTFTALAQPLKLGSAGNSGRGSGLDALKTRYERWLGKVFNDRDGRKGKVERIKRLHDDSVDLATSVLTPGGILPGMRGLCTPLPFLDDLVDFELLEAWAGEIYMPAYDMTMKAYEVVRQRDGAIEVVPKRRVLQFTNKPTDRHEHDERLLAGPEEFRACFSFPFIYPPASLAEGGTLHAFTEGAAQDPINQEGWLDEVVERPVDRDAAAGGERSQEIDRVLMIDTLGAKKMEDHLLREPKGLWQAYGLSLVNAIVGSARARNDDLKWELAQYHSTDRKHARDLDRKPVKWADLVEDYLQDDDLPDDIWAWKHSNLARMFTVGGELAQRFLDGQVSATGRSRKKRDAGAGTLDQDLTSADLGRSKNAFRDEPEYRMPD